MYTMLQESSQEPVEKPGELSMMISYSSTSVINLKNELSASFHSET
jgi:hypothetical protein